MRELKDNRIRHDWTLAKQMHRDGATDRQIADATGLSIKAVVSWRKRKKLPINRQRKETVQWDCMYPQVEDLYRQGYNDPQICELLSIPIHAVFHWRRKGGLPPNSRKKDWDIEAEKDRMKTGASGSRLPTVLYMSDSEILRSWRVAANQAEQVQILAELNLCTRSQMAAYLEHLGADLGKTTKSAFNAAKSEEREKALELYRQGMTDAQVGRVVGRSESTIYMWRQQEGVPGNRRRKDRCEET